MRAEWITIKSGDTILKSFKGNRYCVPVLIAALIVTAVLAASILTVSAYCASNHVEFRPVLLQGEIGNRAYDVIKINDEELYVWTLHYLSEIDLDKVEIKRSAAKNGSFVVVFKFNENGKKRLYRFTKQFAKRQVAIFVENKLITAPLVWVPYFTGDKVAITWPGSEKDLMAFVREVNKAEPGLASLYIDETIAYQDTAAEEWAKYYSELNKYIEEKRKSFSSDVNQVEMMRDVE